ncbi:MAG TPA: hypothetical protein PKA20_29265 [Burkholderiaceae bacterium]|nr:hypothetical protein [Burkholderiaceae bacterium]
MDIQLRTYCITESNGRTMIVHRSDAFIAKLCLGIAGGGFTPVQARHAEHLQHELLCEGRPLVRNGCTIRLVDGHVETIHVGEEAEERILH